MYCFIPHNRIMIQFNCTDLQDVSSSKTKINGFPKNIIPETAKAIKVFSP